MTPEERIDKVIIDLCIHKDKEKAAKEIRDIIKGVFPNAVVTTARWGSDINDVTITFPKVVKMKICYSGLFGFRSLKEYKYSRVTFEEIYGSKYTKQRHEKFPFEVIKQIYEEYKANTPKLEGNILPTMLKDLKTYLPTIQLSFSNNRYRMNGETKIYRYNLYVMFSDLSPKYKHSIEQENNRIILKQIPDDHLKYKDLITSEFDLSDPECFEKIAETLMEQVTSRLNIEKGNHNRLIRSLLKGQRCLRNYIHSAEEAKKHVRRSGDRDDS